jgi:hypothetical protein
MFPPQDYQPETAITAHIEQNKLLAQAIYKHNDSTVARGETTHHQQHPMTTQAAAADGLLNNLSAPKPEFSTTWASTPVLYSPTHQAVIFLQQRNASDIFLAFRERFWFPCGSSPGSHFEFASLQLFQKILKGEDTRLITDRLFGSYPSTVFNPVEYYVEQLKSWLSDYQLLYVDVPDSKKYLEHAFFQVLVALRSDHRCQSTYGPWYHNFPSSR